MAKAAIEAIQLRQNWLGPEHYLLAVLAEPCVATDALNELGVTHEGVTGQLARMNTVNGRKVRYLESRGIVSNPKSHDASGWASGFAAAAGRSKPTPEDWLLAVIYEGGGIVTEALHKSGTSAAAVVEELRRRGVRTPDFLPDQELPWQGYREVEVDKSEWQTVVDILSKRVEPRSGLRWGFNSRRDRPGKIQFAAEDGIDLDAIVMEARFRIGERE